MVAERTPRRGKQCGICGLRVQRPVARPKSEMVSHLPVSALQVAPERPLPTDIRVSCLVQPDAALGHLVVSVGLGQGSVGRGHRIGDDPAVHVAIIRRLVAHLGQYCRDFEEAACTEEHDWGARVVKAAALLDPAPRGQIAAD